MASAAAGSTTPAGRQPGAKAGRSPSTRLSPAACRRDATANSRNQQSAEPNMERQQTFPHGSRSRTPSSAPALHHRQQGLLRAAPGFQEAGKVAALAQLRDLQFQRADSCVPVPTAVTVACVVRSGERSYLAAPICWLTSSSMAICASRRAPSRQKVPVWIDAYLAQVLVQCHTTLSSHRGASCVWVSDNLSEAHDDLLCQSAFTPLHKNYPQWTGAVCKRLATKISCVLLLRLLQASEQHKVLG